MSEILWSLADALELIKSVENVCPKFGCHVALTGGVLYKEGTRKDLDILFYRVRQTPKINRDGLLDALEAVGVHRGARFGWLDKATYRGRCIDMFFPEHIDSKADAQGHYS